MSATIIPTMRYPDPRQAIDFLVRAFGFEAHQIYSDEGGNVIHAELTFGDGMIMIGPDIPSDFAKYMRLPTQVGNVETQICFIRVPDVESHFAVARSEGAEILLPLRKQDYGASDYTCRDPQGHIWSFGDYNPGG
jgi:uncharacterized glyoxalase superfamily protein PhnB